VTERPTRVWWRDPWLWICAAAAGRHAVGAWRLRQTMAFLAQAPPADPSGEEHPTLHLVVPVLWEQAHVGAAVRWFAELMRELPGSTLTIVTTAREEREREYLVDDVAGCTSRMITARRFPQLTPDQLRTLVAAAQAGPRGRLTHDAAVSVVLRARLTCDVVADLLHYPDLADVPIRHVHYAGAGRKAAQVNFAVARLDGAADGDYIAVYDVDSRPDLVLVRHTLGYVAERRQADGELPAVVQQSAVFATRGAAGRAWQRHVCRGSARLQTLWTVRREIPSFRRYTAATRRPSGVALIDATRRGLAQTVGHGLLVRLDVYREMGGLPEYTVLDDLPFGYQLTAAGVPVHVAPVMSSAPAPETVTDLISTHRRWFHNYLDYPACAVAARRAGHGTLAEHAIALCVAGYRAATWMLSSPATAACALTLLRRTTSPHARMFAGAALWLGCATPVRMLAASQADRPSWATQVRDAVEIFAAYLIKSIGPIAAIAQATVPAKGFAPAPKTHRRGPHPEEQG